MAAAILALLVIAPEDLSWGTLKSHLNVSTRVKPRENVVVLDFKAVDNFDFMRKIVKKNSGWKTCENVVVLDFLAVDNFDFTRKNCQKNLGEKLVKMLGFCQNWIFGQKFDFSNSVKILLGL